MQTDIIKIIADHGTNINAVSRLSGVSRQTIYQMRDASFRPRIDTVVAVANAIGCKPSDIYPALNGAQ